MLNTVKNAASFVTDRRLLNWRGWAVGLYMQVIPTAIGRLIDYLGTNGLDATGFMTGAGITLKQLGAMFVFSVVFNALLYIRQHPLPEEIDPIAKAPTVPPFRPASNPKP